MADPRTYPTVRFRADAETLARLEDRLGSPGAGSLHTAAKRDLARYHALLEAELRRVALAPGEARQLLRLARRAPQGSDGARRAAAVQHAAHGPFQARLEAVSPAGLLALLDAAERALVLLDRGWTEDRALRVVGLLTGPAGESPG